MNKNFTSKVIAVCITLISYTSTNAQLSSLSSLIITSATEFVSVLNSNNNIVDSALPVTYTSFNGMTNNNNVLLKWITSEERNNNHFEVEHSFDNNSFKTVGVVLDGFEDGNNKNYQFKESISTLNNKKLVYYRLKQFDTAGNYIYSNVIAVNILANKNAR